MRTGNVKGGIRESRLPPSLSTNCERVRTKRYREEDGGAKKIFPSRRAPNSDVEDWECLREREAGGGGQRAKCGGRVNSLQASQKKSNRRGEGRWQKHPNPLFTLSMLRRSLETAKKERHRGKLLIDEKRRRSLPHPLDKKTFFFSPKNWPYVVRRIEWCAAWTSIFRGEQKRGEEDQNSRRVSLPRLAMPLYPSSPPPRLGPIPPPRRSGERETRWKRE